MTRLVYIGGYGHSGSTLLEYLLAASPKVVACGEVASVLRERGRKGKCTCGREVRLCPLWGPLLASTETLDGMTHERLARALVAQDGGAHAVLVDSSKTAWLSAAVPFRLASELGPDFRLVHLVRDPRAVSWSAVKKSGRRGTRPLMPLRSGSAALGWWVANLACERFGRRYPDRYLRVRYEDLARAPAETMRRLFAEILPESEWRAADDRRKRQPPPALWQPHAGGEPVACRGEGGHRLDARHASRSTARSSRHLPRRSAGATATIDAWEREGSLPRWSLA